jgi:Rrf2 family transcriptional regulator, nitric oxide-sensitive transcriptional repressor
MQLTLYTDYALRILMFLTEKNAQSTIKEIANFYGVSRNHLTKVAHQLGKKSYITSTKGNGGGIRLAVNPKEVTVEKIVKDFEPHFELLECFEMETNTCPIASYCKLKTAFLQAQGAFMDTLQNYTLEMLITRQPARSGTAPTHSTV